MHTQEKERRWRTLVADTFWTLFERFMKVFAKEAGEFLDFLGKHLKVAMMFLVIFATGMATAWLGNWMMGLSPNFKLGGMMLTAVGYVCLLIDGLWLTNVVLPWVPALKRWMESQTPQDGA